MEKEIEVLANQYAEAGYAGLSNLLRSVGAVSRELGGPESFKEPALTEETRERIRQAYLSLKEASTEEEFIVLFNRNIGSTLDDSFLIGDLRAIIVDDNQFKRSVEFKREGFKQVVAMTLHRASRYNVITVGQLRRTDRDKILRWRGVGVKSAAFLSEGFRKTSS